MSDLIKSKEHEQDLKNREIIPVKSCNATYQEIIEAIQKTPDAHIVFQDPEAERIIALIDNYHASLAIGSENWCISSVRYGGYTPGEYYWNWYVGGKDRRQYFVWNLKHPSPDYRLVGTTTNESQDNFYCAYNFPNMSFSMENYIKQNKFDRALFFNNDALRTNPSNVGDNAKEFDIEAEDEKLI